MNEIALNVPILVLKDTIVVNLQFDLNDSLVETLQDQVLEQIERRNIAKLVINVSGLDVIDSYLARMLVSTLKMSSLMGVRSYLAGIRPYVALTLVDMGLERLHLFDVEIVSRVEDVVELSHG